MRNETSTIRRLVRWNANKSTAFVRTLSFDLRNEVTGRVGQVQGLIGAELAPKLGDALVAHIEDAFENGVEEAIRKLPASASQEKVFEAAIAKVNHALSRLLSDRGLVIPTESVNGVLISQNGPTTVATVWGTPSILLIRRVAAGKTRIFDVLDGQENDRGGAANRRGFTNLVSGQLTDKDLMLVSNKNVTDLLDLEAFADIVSAGSPDTVTQMLTDALTAQHDDLSLAILLLEGTPASPSSSATSAHRAQRIKPPVSTVRAKSERAVVTPRPESLVRSATLVMGAMSSKLALAAGSLLSKGRDAVTKAVEERKAQQGPDATETEVPTITEDEEVQEPAEGHDEPDTAADDDMAAALDEAPDLSHLTAPKRPMKRRQAESVLDLLPKNEAEVEDEYFRVGDSPVIAATASRMKALQGKVPSKAMITEADIIAAARSEAAKIIAARAKEREEALAAHQRTEPIVDVPKEPFVLAEEAPIPVKTAHAGTKHEANAPSYGDRSKEALDRLRALAREQANGVMDRVIHWFNGLPVQRRWLLLASLSLILFLNLSVGAAGIKRFGERSAADYEQLLTSIDQKVSSAEASLIYRDEDRARRLLEEAAGVVAALPERSDEQVEKKAELAAFIGEKFDALRHAVALPGPEVVASVTDAGTPPALTRLGSYEGVLWAGDKNGDVYRIDKGTVAKAGDGIRTDIFIPTREGILTGAANSLTLVNASGTATALTLDSGNGEVSINDATTFGSRLYLLDAAHNRILRHAAVSGGYAAGQQYVTDATDLSGAVSFAIDGYVYVLSKDGAVTRLLRGDRTDFSVDAVDPKISSAVRIRTDSDTGDLYVLDSSPTRIIRYDKTTGNLVAQYENEALDGAADFVVDETAKRFLVLRGDQILSFAWPDGE
jgi:hypothetical protein